MLRWWACEPGELWSEAKYASTCSSTQQALSRVTPSGTNTSSWTSLALSGTDLEAALGDNLMVDLGEYWTTGDVVPLGVRVALDETTSHIHTGLLTAARN